MNTRSSSCERTAPVRPRNTITVSEQPGYFSCNYTGRRGSVAGKEGLNIWCTIEVSETLLITVGLAGSSLPVCVDPQAKNIVIACLIGAILAVAFAPGYLKLAAPIGIVFREES